MKYENGWNQIEKDSNKYDHSEYCTGIIVQCTQDLKTEVYP